MKIYITELLIQKIRNMIGGNVIDSNGWWLCSKRVKFFASIYDIENYIPLSDRVNI